MTATNMAEARGLHAALRDFFTRYVHASPDFRALGRVLTLCETAVRTVDDAYCREKLRVAAEYAAELLSQRDRAKWGHDSASGAEFLRQQILNALELYASRLYSLDALRESQAVKEKLKWMTPSSIAQS